MEINILDLINTNGAEFSECRKYRYALWRIWNKEKPLVMFIGLNPSTANEITDDATIRRVTRFALKWGYGGFYMMNLFAYVTAYPEELAAAENPLGDNDKWLKEIGEKCEQVIFAWGAFDIAQERCKEVIKMFPGAKALIINKDGSPRHPLYVKANTIPVEYLTEVHNDKLMVE